MTKEVVGLALLYAAATAAMEPWEYQQQEAQQYFNGLAQIQYSGWGPTNYKVQKIIAELVQFSGESYRVIPGQTFQWGQAHADGWIILDISTATGPNDLLAFKLAHEWGHQALGHQPSIYHPAGSAWRFKMNPTDDEDDADRYAGRFLRASGHPLAPVVAYLRALPPTPPGDTHSSGSRRAELVTEGYGGMPGEGETERRSCRELRVACSHLEQQQVCSLCTHPLHTADTGPCNHPCQNPYGYGAVPCHQYDTYPCVHPAHNGDCMMMQQLAHPEGDVSTVCD